MISYAEGSFGKHLKNRQISYQSVRGHLKKHSQNANQRDMTETNSDSCNCIFFKIGTLLKGKNLIPLGANSFL